MCFHGEGRPSVSHEHPLDFNREHMRAQNLWFTQAVPGMDWSKDGMEQWSLRYAGVCDGNERTSEDFRRMLKDIAKKKGATTFPDDPAFQGANKSQFAARILRHNIMQYSSRLFTSPESTAFDMPWYIPQYIGKSEIENSLKLRGYLMPDDEEAHEYYSNRRLEANAVEV